MLTKIVNSSATPKYMICDKGKQFWCDAFKAWCDGHGITPRFGAVGRHSSIALQAWKQTFDGPGQCDL